ncbi:MAG: hypothetical protein P1U47_13175 [Zhongshania sp.]|uniref:hypothetical protein n=1 Tax=Zhongshania sp. TaxID=1971902 RepID=UPI00261478BA|nr:hypothetical protein [Zhongshania sp.]MDF1693325.1 hypothetical protein [Zhongshania sp.]
MRNPLLNTFIIASLVLFGGLYYYSGQVEDHYSDNAARYLNASLTSISSWQVADLKAQLSAETLDKVDDEQLAKLCADYAHLGQFQSMETPLFSRLSGALSLFSEPPKLSYSSNVHFEHGNAVMTATLTLEKQHFRLYNLNLGKPEQSPAAE